MELERRIGLAVMASVAVFAVALYAIGDRMIDVGVARVERDLALLKVRDLDRALTASSRDLDRLGFDWGSWDDTWSFLAHHDPSYDTNNLNPRTLTEIGIDAVVLLDARGTVVRALRVLDAQTTAEVGPPFDDAAWMSLPADAAATTGLVAGPDAVWLVTQHPVTPSVGGGPFRGTLVFGRLADAELFGDPVGQSPITLRPYAGPPVDPTVESSDDAMTTRLTLRDIAGQPTILAEVASDRPMAPFAAWGRRWLLVVLVGATTIFSFAIQAVLRGMLLRRLATLDRQVQALTTNPDASTPIALPGDDALSRLAGGVSDLVRALQGRNVTLRSQGQALETAWNAAESASRAKSEFLANVSHEMRTPLNGIIGVTDLMATEPLPTPVRHHVDLIRTSSDTLLSLIQQVLDFSRLDAGRVTLDPSPCDLRDLVDEVLALVATQLKGKPVELVGRIAPDVPTRVIADRARLKQVLLNLVSNAAKFTDRGHIVVRVITEDSHGTRRFRFLVEDTGVGIDREMQAHVFERFAQVDASSTRRIGGTGLGLTISRELVELMGGHIGLKSEVGTGSTFWFSVPLPVSRPAAPVKTDGPRVLVVTGHPEVAAGMVEALVVGGMRGWFATRISEARRMLDLADRPFDAALIDDVLPDGSGDSLLRQWKDRQNAPRVTIRVTASRVQPEDWEGTSGLLVRPVANRLLVAAVAEAIERRTAARAPAPPGSAEPPRPVAQETPNHRMASPATLIPENLGLRVLMAEDNHVNQTVARMMLMRVGVHDIDVVPNGALAVERVLANSYDLVLMDCLMPEMDGYEAARTIRARERGRRTPICALTANAMDGDRERCLACGMDEFLAKPLRLEDLTAALQRLCGHQPPPGTVPPPARPPISLPPATTEVV